MKILISVVVVLILLVGTETGLLVAEYRATQDLSAELQMVGRGSRMDSTRQGEEISQLRNEVTQTRKNTARVERRERLLEYLVLQIVDLITKPDTQKQSDPSGPNTNPNTTYGKTPAGNAQPAVMVSSVR